MPTVRSTLFMAGVLVQMLALPAQVIGACEQFRISGIGPRTDASRAAAALTDAHGVGLEAARSGVEGSFPEFRGLTGRLHVCLERYSVAYVGVDLRNASEGDAEKLDALVRKLRAENETLSLGVGCGETVTHPPEDYSFAATLIETECPVWVVLDTHRVGRTLSTVTLHIWLWSPDAERDIVTRTGSSVPSMDGGMEARHHYCGQAR